MAAILLSSNRDRVKLQEGGYLYVFDKLSTNGEKKFWRCERKSECNARIHTDAVTNVVVKRASEHNHPSNVEITSSGSVLSGPKRRAYEPIEDLSQLDNLQMRFSRDSHHFNHSLATDALQKMIQRKKMRTNTNDEIGSPSHTSSNNGYANEGISVEEVMAQSDDGQTNPNTSQSSHFLSGTMAVKEEGLSRTQQQQQNNLRDRSAIAAELICERAPEIAATSTASITASAAASSTLPTVAAVRPKRSTAQINVIPIGVDKYLMGGFVCWSQKIALIVEDSELVARMVCNSDRKQFASILFTGAPNTGKSCLAAIATKCVESTMVRVCSGDDMIALTDVAKVTALRKVLEDTYSNTVNVVLLDNVDRLIEYCPVGSKYSNVVLQALLILLKKTPPPNHRLLIIATASDQCARAFGMHDLFTSVFDVPPLSTVDHLMAVIEDFEIFTDADYGRLRSRLSERSSSYSIGVKKLLDLLELAKQSDPRSRVDFLCTRLEKLISA